MVALHWGVRKARIWLDELPAWDYEITEVVEHDQKAFYRGTTPLHGAAVELVVPVGAMVNYGGISMIFTPTQIEKLVVQLPSSPGDGVPFGESLVGKGDMPYIGFPREYVSGVLEGLMQAERTPLLGSGTLRLCGAVHGKVGSSKWVFRILDKIVVKLLTLETGTLSEERFIELLDTEIRW